MGVADINFKEKCVISPDNRSRKSSSNYSIIFPVHTAAHLQNTNFMSMVKVKVKLKVKPLPRTGHEGPEEE